MAQTEAGAAYERALRFRRVNPNVAYYDPTAPAPELDTRERPRTRRREMGGEFWVPSFDYVTLMMFALLMGIGYLFLRYSGSAGWAFSTRSENAERAKRLQPVSGGDDERPASLGEIERQTDRRKGVVMLARKALAAATEANGVMLQRSWTARDALRHVPADQPHRSALQTLVMAAEGVLFGEHDMSEEEFQRHLAATRPLLRGATS